MILVEQIPQPHLAFEFLFFSTNNKDVFWGFCFDKSNLIFERVAGESRFRSRQTTWWKINGLVQSNSMEISSLSHPVVRSSKLPILLSIKTRLDDDMSNDQNNLQFRGWIGEENGTDNNSLGSNLRRPPPYSRPEFIRCDGDIELRELHILSRSSLDIPSIG